MKQKSFEKDRGIFYKTKKGDYKKLFPISGSSLKPESKADIKILKMLNEIDPMK